MASVSRINHSIVAWAVVAFAVGAPARADEGDASDPLAEVRHEKRWLDVLPAPPPTGLPLRGPKGTDAEGYPRQVVDGPALRSLLVRRCFKELSSVLERFQRAAERDPRYESWIHDSFGYLGYPHREERALIDAWLKATPRSFAPHVADAAFWVHTGFAWRGSRFAPKTSEFEFLGMEEAFEKAREAIDRSLRLHPRLVEPLSLRISVEIAGGSRAAAEAAMEEGLAICPGCLAIREQWLWALEPRWGGSLEEMEEFATRRAEPGFALQKRRLPVTVLLERAQLAFEDGKRDEARSLVERACAIGGDPRPFLARARGRKGPGTLAAYVADLDAAEALDPGNVDVLAGRIGAFLMEERWEEAGRTLLELLRAKPTSATGASRHARMTEALDSLAWKEHLAGRDASAARLYQLLGALAPRSGAHGERARTVERAARSSGGPAGPPVKGNPDPRVVVRVVDEGGRPIGGVRVRIGPEKDALWLLRGLLANPQEKGEEVDEEGKRVAEVRPGRHVVYAGPSAFPAVGTVKTVTVPITGLEVRMELRRATPTASATQISGRVLDLGGRPGAPVELIALPTRLTGDGVTPQTVVTVRSNADGTFNVPGTDPGDYTIVANGSPMFTLTRAGATGVNVRIESKRTLAGRILVAEGASGPVPADRFTVQLGNDRHEFAREAGGRFSVPVPPGFAGPAWVSVPERPARPAALDPRVDTNLGDVVVGKGRRLRGRVLDPTGSTVWGATIALKHGSELGKTTSEGTFEIMIPDGPQTLAVSHREWLPWEAEVPMDREEQDVRLEKGAALKAIVVDSQARPIPGASLILDGGPPRRCMTDPTGRCAFQGLPSGNYRLRPGPEKSPAGLPGPPLSLALGHRETLGIRYEWATTPTKVSFHLDGVEPSPLPYMVWLFPGAPSFRDAFGEDGKPRLPRHMAQEGAPLLNLAPGRYLVVSRDHRNPNSCAVETLELSAGEERALTLKLADGACR